MEKINVILVLLNRETLEESLKKLNLDNVNIAMIVAEGEPDEKFFKIGKKKVPRTAFSAVHDTAVKYKDFIWLVSGCVNGKDDLAKTKKLLMMLGVPENNIVNLEVSLQFSPTWLANLRYVEENSIDFFATGNEYMRDGLDFKYIPNVQVGKRNPHGGVNLADSYQDLRQSYLTAKYVFAHTKPGTIKFVLIGLLPYSFRYDNEKDFSNQRNLQYFFDLKNTAENTHNNLIGVTPFEFMYLCRFKNTPEEDAKEDGTAYDVLLKNLLNDDVKNVFATTDTKADLNFDAIKKEFYNEFSDKATPTWEDDLKFLNTGDVEKNIQILKDYIELCLANGAKPVGVIPPYSAVKRKVYSKGFLKNFYDIIHQLEESYDFICVDLFERCSHNSFCDINHLNKRGILTLNSLLSLRLYKKNLIPLKNFCDMNYSYFYQLSWIAPKDDYNAFMEDIFRFSTQVINRKKKIKVAFVVRTAAEWCGDDLYNLFARDKRFETTVFLCLRVDKTEDEKAKKEFLQGVEQFESHGLNVVAVNDLKEKSSGQDILISSMPYLSILSTSPVAEIFTPKTLIAYVPYALDIALYDLYKQLIFHVGWKFFFYSAKSLEAYDKSCRLGMPRGFYSGHPKIDNFFTGNANFSFFWKIARANTKKIIWAPHWSINEGVLNSTFQWNYQFMYEFAKAHPEISWVVKPHPYLVFAAVESGLFPSDEAFKEYIQKWNDLPNAQVYTGAYYQSIFATSDGMIHDSSSFVAEYQYADKPMIFLTRDTQKFYELGEEILKVSYLVDGSDLDAIAEMIQKVFIEGKDNKAVERKELFDKYLNYPKLNGMLASEFVYKSIADEFKK